MKSPARIIPALKNRLSVWREHRRPGSEADKATAFWAGLEDYHLTNDDDPIAIARSRWLTTDVVPSLDIDSLIEVGCNTGRNLHYISGAFPSMRLRGIDINLRALEAARSTKPEIEFVHADANEWAEPDDEWACALTMSVLDHIPRDAAEALVRNIRRSCRHAVSVELWDGSEGERALYKYSWDLRSMYEDAGFKTLRWEPLPDALQYDAIHSHLWLYVGRS